MSAMSAMSDEGTSHRGSFTMLFPRLGLSSMFIGASGTFPPFSHPLITILMHNSCIVRVLRPNLHLLSFLLVKYSFWALELEWICMDIIFQFILYTERGIHFQIDAFAVVVTTFVPNPYD